MVPSSQVPLASISNVEDGGNSGRGDRGRTLDNWVERETTGAGNREESDDEDEEDNLWQFPKGPRSGSATTSKRR